MKRLTIAASSLIVLLAACEAPRDSIETTIQPTRVDVPSMTTQEVKPPRARGVAFRVATDPGMATATTAPLMPPNVPEQTVPNIGGQMDPKGAMPGVQVPIEQPIFVVGLSQGKRPTAAVIGWTKPFVTVGDRLGKARVVKIDMDGVHLDDGTLILVTSATTAVAGPTTAYTATNGRVVPNISTTQQNSTEAVTSNGNGNILSSPTPTETLQPNVRPMQ